MSTKIIIGVLAIGGLFLLVTIYGTSGNEVTTPQTETETAVESAASLPVDMPTNVPMYPGAILQGVQRNDSDTERNITLTLTTPDSVADVNTWYRGALKENGWAVTDDKNVGGYILLKGENATLTTFTQAANNEGATVITQRIRIR